MLDNEHGQVRAVALKVLAEFWPPQFLAPIACAKLRDPDPRVQITAIQVVPKLQEYGAALAREMSVLQHSDLQLVRLESQTALVALGEAGTRHLISGESIATPQSLAAQHESKRQTEERFEAHIGCTDRTVRQRQGRGHEFTGMFTETARVLKEGVEMIDVLHPNAAPPPRVFLGGQGRGVPAI